MRCPDLKGYYVFGTKSVLIMVVHVYMSMHTYVQLFISAVATHVVIIYAFTVSADVDRECSDDFYLDNSSGLCRPECGEWDQYSPSTHHAVVGINITFVLITILICVATFVWSIVRHKIM